MSGIKGMRRRTNEEIAEYLSRFNKTFIGEIERDEKGRPQIAYICNVCDSRGTIITEWLKKIGPNCRNCHPQRYNKVPWETVVAAFDELELTLHSSENEYKTGASKLKCTCRKCNATGYSSWALVRRGARPCKCGRLFGEDNPKWNPNLTDEERMNGRNNAEYANWRREVYKRDNWTCQICHQKGLRIEAHHLYNYTDFPDTRTVVSNGVTLCVQDHDEFHKRYGYRFNTKEQFDEFRHHKLAEATANKEVDRKQIAM